MSEGTVPQSGRPAKTRWGLPTVLAGTLVILVAQFSVLDQITYTTGNLVGGVVGHPEWGRTAARALLHWVLNPIVLWTSPLVMPVGIPMVMFYATWRSGTTQVVEFGFPTRILKGEVRQGFVLACLVIMIEHAVTVLYSAVSTVPPAVSATAEGTLQAEPWLLVYGVFSAILLAPVLEEWFFRGLLLRYFLRVTGATDPAGSPTTVRAGHWGVAVSIVMSSMIFSIMHVWFEPGGHVAVASVLFDAGIRIPSGIVFAVAAVRTERLAVPMIAHSLSNAIPLVMAL